LGSSLATGRSKSAAFFGILALSLLSPEASAQSQRKAKATRTAPLAAALALTGSYTLTKVAGRPVRDVELAKSKVVFAATGSVLIETACETGSFSTTLQARSRPGQILGFEQTARPLIGCAVETAAADATTSRLFRETTNIARAGSTLTFFNAVGAPIAQWTATNANPALSEPTASQPAAPAPLRAESGDYVLVELNGNPIAAFPPRQAPRPHGAPSASEAAPTSVPANTQFVTNVPTLFLREDGRVMGGGGCNQYTSRLIPGPNSVNRFGPVASTKKACLDRATGRLEGAFLSALREADRVEINAARIILYRRDSIPSARLGSISARAHAAPSLYGTNWILRSLNDIPVRQSNPPNITFAGNEASGSAGCNRFTIQHSRRNNKSVFTRGVLTRMACAPASRSTLESRFMRTLETIASMEITTTTLTLRSDDRQNVMIFDAQ
jgi:heat shock protein HslJ